MWIRTNLVFSSSRNVLLEEYVTNLTTAAKRLARVYRILFLFSRVISFLTFSALQEKNLRKIDADKHLPSPCHRSMTSNVFVGFIISETTKR